MTEELAGRLFEAGCDAGTPGPSCGVSSVGFARVADSPTDAIRSAVADVREAGVAVAPERHARRIRRAVDTCSHPRAWCDGRFSVASS